MASTNLHRIGLAILALGVTACGRAPEHAVSGAGGIGLKNALDTPYPAPELTGIQGWLNSPPLTMKSLQGKVVLVDFWTYSCINCVRTFPHLEEWDKKYRDQGLVIIGVHSPEFKFEKDMANIKTAVAKYHIGYAVADDSNMAMWNAFKNQYWPAQYLIDQSGEIVYTHFGEGDDDITENNIRHLLLLPGDVSGGDDATHSYPRQTPETYLGLKNGDREMDSAKGLPTPDYWSLTGKWKHDAQKITSGAVGDILRLHFNARKVFLVMGTSTGKPVDVTLKLNGEAPGKQAGKDVHGDTVTVSGHALYELISQDAMTDIQLELTAKGPGVELYAFTFGS